MKLKILLFLFLITGYATAIAQKPKTDEITNKQKARSFIDRIAPKIEVTKAQKDSLVLIFTQFMDDVEKYRAGNNATIITYLMKARDEKVKSLLRDEAKFDKYLLTMADIQKPREPQQSPSQQPGNGGGQQQHMGGGQNDRLLIFES
jgi:hypothetical protein